MELSRATFQRLVRLHLVLLPVWLGVAMFEVTSTRWARFSERFDRLVVDDFGAAPIDASDENVVLWQLALAVILLAGNIAATVGLLWFKRWARAGFWGSLVALFAAWLVGNGYRPGYTSPLSDLLNARRGADRGDPAAGLRAWARPGLVCRIDE